MKQLLKLLFSRNRAAKIRPSGWGAETYNYTVAGNFFYNWWLYGFREAQENFEVDVWFLTDFDERESVPVAFQRTLDADRI